MNARKLLITLMLVCLFTMVLSSAVFAKSTRLTKEEKLIAKASGDTKSVSGEEVKEEAKEEVSGEEAKPSEKTEEAKPSGEAATEPAEEAKTSGEEPKASGEEATKPAEEVKESGEEATKPAEEAKTSGEEPKVSGDEEKASGEKAEEPEIKANDINGNEWYAKFAQNAIDNKFMDLDKDGNFNANANVTRGEVIDALSKGVNAKYSIEVANQEAFLNTTATREETCYLVYLYAKSQDKGFKGTWAFLLDYDDVDQISEEAYEAVAWCNMNKIVIGRSLDTLNPTSVTTRAELATIVTRTIGVMGE